MEFSDRHCLQCGSTIRTKSFGHHCSRACMEAAEVRQALTDRSPLHHLGQVLTGNDEQELVTAAKTDKDGAGVDRAFRRIIAKHGLAELEDDVMNKLHELMTSGKYETVWEWMADTER